MKSATRDHLIFPGCIFFFFLQSSLLSISQSCCLVCPSSSYSSIWLCWPLIPVDLSSLIPYHSPPTFIQPLLLAPRVVTSSPEQPTEMAKPIYSEGFEMAGETFLLMCSFASDECAMCSSGLLLSHVDKGCTFLMWMGLLFFLFLWTLHLCSLLLPVSGSPSYGRDWKRSHSRNVVTIAKRVLDMIGRCVFSMCRL